MVASIQVLSLVSLADYGGWGSSNLYALMSLIEDLPVVTWTCRSRRFHSAESVGIYFLPYLLIYLYLYFITKIIPTKPAASCKRRPLVGTMVNKWVMQNIIK